MSVIERLKSTEAVIGGVVALVAVVAKYAAFSSLLELPEGVSGLAPFLSTLTVIVFTLLLIYLSKSILKLNRALVGAVIAAMLVAGIYLAAEFVSDVRSQRLRVRCTDYESGYILEPVNKSARLEQLIEDGGSLRLAWCEENKDTVRLLVERENTAQIKDLTLALILAESLLTLAITMAAWLVANQAGSRAERRRSGRGGASPRAPRDDPEPPADS